MSVLRQNSVSHCMRNKYDSFDFDEDAGLKLNGEVFCVKRPHASFYIPVRMNSVVDPFPLLEKITMDKDDVLICSPSKTGTHWSYEIIKMLKTGRAEYTALPKEVEWIDVNPYDKVKSFSPSGSRVLSTHLPLSKLPPNFRRSDTKVLITMRNLKDVIVSGYHHRFITRKISAQADQDPKQIFQTHFKCFLYSRKIAFGNHFDSYREFWLESKLDPNVLIVFFEDLKRNTKVQIRRIADHLRVAYTDSLIDNIADAVDIQKMKEGKRESEQFFRDKFGDSATLYRKGEIGDWKNHLTVAQNEEFDRVFKEWNKDLQIPFIWE